MWALYSVREVQIASYIYVGWHSDTFQICPGHVTLYLEVIDGDKVWEEGKDVFNLEETALVEEIHGSTSQSHHPWTSGGAVKIENQLTFRYLRPA